ncbi:ABC-F family ATP-binding cassette domain-containing protein [Caviibacter abscessus]|uniref:ABC-F family ATP-binding cassette domain-containing protein n=1 Tax=Caviibacter abscessus TaxID=1766719 RepID=UPI00082A721F|nr:ABC-F family ATP-binding cassette domain-containing protein [Caviibacter abscessus]
MNLVQFNNVSKQFIGQSILENISFTINSKDKIGLIGLNGAGKSTIIKIILGIERIDEGNIFVNNNTIIGYLSQNHDFYDEKNTVFEEISTVFQKEKEILKKIQKLNIDLQFTENTNDVLKQIELLATEYEALDGYNSDYKIKQVITGLELNALENSLISELSGGEKTRVTLAKLLLKNPDLLILDEPTNHLDLISIEWLEEYLIKYNKAFLVVSHDRIFLDNICNKILELENKKIYKYNGNFSDFILQKELILKGELKRYEKEQEKIKKLEEYIERNRAGRMAKQAKGRQKILDRIERMDDPIFNPKRMKLKFETKTDSGENVLEIKNISKTFDNKKVLNNINFKLYKGEKVGIIGKNGIGKSTLLKIIYDKIKADSGEIIFGSRVETGYYDQDHQNLYSKNTILQEINTSINYTEEYLRSVAGGFLFSADDVLKEISTLSGGEKVRVSFIKLIQNKPNLLLLDEPTNHLDIYSIEILENAIENYDGSMLLVSHNRHFLNSVCNTIYILDQNGLSVFKGNYDDYKESLKSSNTENKETSKKLSYLEQKELSKRIQKLKRDIESIENRNEQINLEKKELEKQMFDTNNATNLEKLMEIQEKIKKLDDEELKILELWEKHNKELENLNE